ncbi:MAG: endonuclease/exonuclease/phosphatase family protein, partial [Bdellovibrionota bacterium]
MKFFKGLAIALCAASTAASINASAAAAPSNISITTFNIRYYGLGGSMGGTPAQEKRDATLKKFIAQYVPHSDLFVFQEIVDVDRLVKKVLPTNFECISYKHADPKHQHVVLCHKTDKLSFEDDPNDPDSLIQEVSVNARSRPAVHTLVANRKGEVLFRLIGVHLKAFPHESTTRLGQIQSMTKFLSASKTQVPVVIGGDFNTYNSDPSNFSKVFKSSGLNLVEAKNPNTYTFRKGNMRSKFDRFWISNSALSQVE